MCAYDAVMDKLKKNFGTDDIVITTRPDIFIIDNFALSECLLELFEIDGFMVVAKGDLAKSGITSEDLKSLGLPPLMDNCMADLMGAYGYAWDMPVYTPDEKTPLISLSDELDMVESEDIRLPDIQISSVPEIPEDEQLLCVNIELPPKEL